VARVGTELASSSRVPRDQYTIHWVGGGGGSLKSLLKFLEVKNFEKSIVNISLEISPEVL